MKVVKIIVALVALISSLAVGVYWGRHRTTTKNFAVTTMEESVAKYENKAAIKNDAVLNANSKNKAVITNMYQKPIKTSSSKENLMISFKNVSGKLKKVNSIKGMQIEKIADEVHKQTQNNSELRDLLATLYAEIRQEKTNEDIQEFFKTEQEWGTKNLNISVIAEKTDKNAEEQEYYYYEACNDELMNKCSYLINNILV